MTELSGEDLIFETKCFLVERHPKPFVSREEGGHIRIFPKDKERVTDRTKLTAKEATEYMLLSMVTGEALKLGMNERGVKVVWVNYEDLGNWPFKRKERPVMHLHVFGRVWEAKKQVFPEAVQLPDRSSGFYDGFVPLDKDDVVAIRKHIEILIGQKKYDDVFCV